MSEENIEKPAVESNEKLYTFVMIKNDVVPLLS